MERVEIAFRRAALDLFPEKTSVLVAVSGGPDSVALLHLLHRFARGRSLALTVAHLDHVDAVDLDPRAALSECLTLDFDRLRRGAAHHRLEHPVVVADVEGTLGEVDVGEKGQVAGERLADSPLALGRGRAGGAPRGRR